MTRGHKMCICKLTTLSQARPMQSKPCFHRNINPKTQAILQRPLTLYLVMSVMRGEHRNSWDTLIAVAVFTIPGSRSFFYLINKETFSLILKVVQDFHDSIENYPLSTMITSPITPQAKTKSNSSLWPVRGLAAWSVWEWLDSQANVVIVVRDSTNGPCLTWMIIRWA